jgi:hypothetical protein
MIAVKAAPVPTAQLQESMCVAGIHLGSEPRWIRLFPIPFRDLADDSKFRKYEEVTLQATRPSNDRRPESWVPIEGSITTGRFFGTEHGWSARRERIAGVGEWNMCDLIALNRSGSGSETPSLAVVRPVVPPEVLITPRDQDQLDSWRSRAATIANRPSLFDDPHEVKHPYEPAPWRFRYAYRCRAPGCKGHTQTIVDWEVETLWRNVRRQETWRDLMQRKFRDELWAPDRDTVLFVGNMGQRPHNFLVLGVFWPPQSAIQPSLL